jgi:hypothetical protein
VDLAHTILEMYNVAENQTLSLAYRMVADHPLFGRHLAQMNILNIILHV